MFKNAPGKPPPLLQRIFFWVEDFSPIVLLNALWFLASLLVIPALPATAALFYSMNELAHDRGATFTKFFEGFKRYFWLSFKWGLPSVIIFVVLIYNIFFYGQVEGQITVMPQLASVAQLLSILMLVVFSSMQLYMFPLLLEQVEPSLKNAIRNSFLIFVRFPLHTFGLLILITLLILISTLMAQWLWPLVTAGVSTYFANRLLIHLVARMPRAEDQEKEKK